MKPVSWEEVSYYLSAGNIVSIKIEETFTEVRLTIIYGNDDTVKEAYIEVACTGCSYMDWRRTNYHEAGSGIVFEAYLHDSSPLITSLFSHRLQGVAGTLPLEVNRQEVRHFEVIGEVSVNILCSDVKFQAEGLPQSPVG